MGSPVIQVAMCLVHCACRHATCMYVSTCHMHVCTDMQHACTDMQQTCVTCTIHVTHVHDHPSQCMCNHTPLPPHPPTDIVIPPYSPPYNRELELRNIPEDVVRVGPSIDTMKDLFEKGEVRPVIPSYLENDPVINTYSVSLQ